MPQENQQNSGIPQDPTIASQVAAATAGGNPVQIHQGAPAGIPAHPTVQVQQHQSQMQDFFQTMGLDGGDDNFEAPQGQPSGAPSVPSAPATVDLLSEEDLLGGGISPQAPEPAAPQQTQQPPPAGTPTQAQQPPVQQQAPQQQQAPAPASDPEALRLQAIDYLRNGTYQFNEEQSRRALTEPEVVLPELAARLHVNVVQEMATQMHRVLPQLIEQEVARRQAAFEAKQEFFSQYPKLNRPEWQATILESLQMAAQLNQGKSRQEIMREGAALAAYRIRSSHRAAPSPQRQAPYTPAAPGSGGTVVPQNPQNAPNPWADLAADPELFNW